MLKVSLGFLGLCIAHDQAHIPQDYYPPSVVYKKTAAELGKLPPIDVLLLQDFTTSFNQPFPEEPGLEVEVTNTTWSLAIFKDKPIPWLGEVSDFCFGRRVVQAGSPKALTGIYSGYVPHGGWDWAENQYGALMAALLSPITFPWRRVYASGLVVLITDSGPHFEGDSAQAYFPDLLPWGDSYNEFQEDQYCLQRYYPSAETVKAALLSTGTRLGQIIIDPEANNGQALAVANWFNDLLGQPQTYVIAHSPSVNWWTELQSIVSTFRAEQTATTPSSAPIATDYNDDTLAAE